MTGLIRLAVLCCVFLIQRAASQGCSCQSELYISIDDLVKAINNGPGFPGITEPNQQSCCNQQSCDNQQPCGNQLSYGNQQSCGNQQSGGNQQPCGNQQSYGNQQPCGNNKQPCGCNQQSQPSISISNRPISFGQVQQPLSIPSIPISSNNQQFGCQPSIYFSQLSQQCGCQPSVSISQSSNQCGCQPQQSLTISNPSISFQPISSGQCGQQIQLNNVQPQSQVVQVPEVPACIVPAALLQAPPYGIIFAGENLLIDGAVQVCGNVPFNSIIEFSGLMPSSGSGCVQYVCDDTC